MKMLLGGFRIVAVGALNEVIPLGPGFSISRGAIALEQVCFLMRFSMTGRTRFSVMQACRSMDIHQAFISYNNPKGNADTERMMRTIKEELVWLKEWHSPFEFTSRFERWAEVDYNQNYRHSTLKNKTPLMFEKEHIDSRNTQFAQA